MRAPSCPTLCNLTDSSPPSSSVHRLSQARILEWVVISSTRGIFLTQGLNPHLLHLLYHRWMLYLLSHHGSLEWTNEYGITFQYYPKPYVTKHGSHISKGLLVWVHPEFVNILPLQNFLSFLHLVVLSSLISAKVVSLEWHFYLRQESDPKGLYQSRQKAVSWPLHQLACCSFPPLLKPETPTCLPGSPSWLLVSCIHSLAPQTSDVPSNALVPLFLFWNLSKSRVLSA